MLGSEMKNIRFIQIWKEKERNEIREMVKNVGEMEVKEMRINEGIRI